MELQILLKKDFPLILHRHINLNMEHKSSGHSNKLRHDLSFEHPLEILIIVSANYVRYVIRIILKYIYKDQ